MNQTLGRGTILISYFILAVGAVIALFPLSLMVISALKTSAEIVANPLAVWLSPGKRRLPTMVGILLAGAAIIATVPLWAKGYVLPVLIAFPLPAVVRWASSSVEP